jgi:hypothetical protein
MDSTTTLTLVVDAKNNAEAALKSVQTSVGNLKTKLDSIKPALQQVTAGATLAFGAIVGFATITVQAASKAQAEMAKFNATMDATGKGSEKAKVQLMELSKKFIQLGFDDEDTANMLAKFYQRTKDVTEANKLSVLAMDLARAKSIDLGTATNLVNLALSGSGRALLQYGIVIKDAATPMEALGILQSKVGGQAIAFADTFAGKMAILDVQVTNLKESIGTAFLPILTDLLIKITPVIEKMIAWVDANPKLTTQIIAVTAAVTGLTAATGAIALMLFALNPVAIVIVGIIADLTLIGITVYKIWKDWKYVWIQMQIDFQHFIDGMMKAFKPFIDAWTFIKGINLKDTLSSVGSGITSGLKQSALGQWIIGSKAEGGYIPQTGPYLMHKGEFVTKSDGSNGGMSFQFIFNGDVNDRDALQRSIMEMLNRTATLRQMGAR